MFSGVSQLFTEVSQLDFNSDPYSMGTFKDIVRNSRKKEKTFTLGFSFSTENGDVE